MQRITAPHRFFGRMALFLAFSALGACSGSDDAPPPGGNGCTPGARDGCPAGQICSADGVCTPDGSTPGALVIETASARACEVLLSSSGSAQVVSAAYGSGTKGVLRARPPRFAIALNQTNDTPFDSSAITLQIEGSASELSVQTVNCFDSAGAALPSATATLR